MKKKIKILVADFSSIQRNVLSELFTAEKTMEVIGAVRTPKDCLATAIEERPSVIVIALRAPYLPWFEAIGSIMAQIPTPIIVLSNNSYTQATEALEKGAIEILPFSPHNKEQEKKLLQVISIANNIVPITHVRKHSSIGNTHTPPSLINSKVIAVGASTGGPQSLKALLSSLPGDLNAGMLIVQHIATGFLPQMVEWLQNYTPLSLEVAHEGSVISPSKVLFAPTRSHMHVEANGTISLWSGARAPEKNFIPSIDITMTSAAQIYGKNMVGIIMTGIGKDGAEGMKAIQAAGGITIAQDKHSSVVFGMNKECIEKGYIKTVLPLTDLSTEILRITKYNLPV
jgi:two-component system, chemotaxis family, protein-glutamate methylesterase/glutaminase